MDKNFYPGFIIFTGLTPVAEILDLFVIEQQRKKSFATVLLHNTVKLLKDRNFSELHLEVAENNQPALNLYLKFGFKVVGNRKDYYFQGCAAILLKVDLLT